MVSAGVNGTVGVTPSDREAMSGDAPVMSCVAVRTWLTVGTDVALRERVMLRTAVAVIVGLAAGDGARVGGRVTVLVGCMAPVTALSNPGAANGPRLGTGGAKDKVATVSKLRISTKPHSQRLITVRPYRRNIM